MVIRHSTFLLEQLSDIEDRIQQVEKLMDLLGIDCDQEQLIKKLLSKKYGVLSEQQKKN